MAFLSSASDMVAGDTNAEYDVFIRDRCAVTPTTTRASVASNGAESNGPSFRPALSADGGVLTFLSYATTFGTGSTIPGVERSFVRTFDPNNLASGATANVQPTTADQAAILVTLSKDGRFAFFGADPTLVSGHQNPIEDIFTRDLLTQALEVVSVASDGSRGNGKSGLTEGKITSSPDGRYVAFTSQATNLAPGGAGVFVHDRLTGITERVAPLPSDRAWDVGVSENGQTVAYQSNSDVVGVVPTDANGFRDVYVHGPDRTDLAHDFTGDGSLDDDVLTVIDAATAAQTPLCPATATAIANGAAAFLRPESAGSAPSLPGCPTGPLVGGNPDLNGDGDASDDVMHFGPPGPESRTSTARPRPSRSRTPISPSSPTPA